MTNIELIKMSAKGQLVVPQDIRGIEGFRPGERFVAMRIKGGVVFKRVDLPNMKAEFEKISQEVVKQFRKQKIKRKDVVEAVKWAKQKSS